MNLHLFQLFSVAWKRLLTSNSIKDFQKCCFCPQWIFESLSENCYFVAKTSTASPKSIKNCSLFSFLSAVSSTSTIWSYSLHQNADVLQLQNSFYSFSHGFNAFKNWSSFPGTSEPNWLWFGGTNTLLCLRNSNLVLHFYYTFFRSKDKFINNIDGNSYYFPTVICVLETRWRIY